VEHGKANLDLESIEAYDLEVETKYVTALHALRDLKYPMVDQMESLKDAPIDVIMASLHLESDSGEDAPQWISELRPSSSQLKIHVYPKYPMVDQLESLKDAPIDVIMASLHLESDTREDAPQWIRELRPNSSQLKIPVYPE
nr:hypothetical protein [Tanacetum cinerariifolium]